MLDYGLDVEVAETGLIGAVGSGAEQVHCGEMGLESMLGRLRECG